MNGITRLICTRPLSSAVALGCGGESGKSRDDTIDLDGESKPRLETVELTRLAVTSDEAFMLLRPVRVEVELDVAGDAFDSDVLVGLSADDGALGCVLGALEAKQDEAGDTHLKMESDFLVKGDCAALVDRSDVELFVAFDPWGELDVERTGEPSDEVTSLFDLTRASVLGTEACEDCRVATTVASSPGIDAVLREVNLGSSVAVLPVAANGDGAEIPADDRPQFAVSTATRIDGLDRGAVAPDGNAYLTYRIRPLNGASGTDALDTEAMDWSPLLERVDDDGTPEYFEQTTLETKGGHALQHAAAVYIGDEMADRMATGDWHRVNEFELQTCVNTDFDQAIYPGESAPRDNDCAVLPVVIARDFIDETGASPARRTPEGSAKSRLAQAFGVDWSTTNNFAGTNYTNGLNFVAWLDLNASNSATSTYGGHTISGPATWFEAGAKSTATVFNTKKTVLDAYLTAIGYNNGAGGIDAKVEAFGQSILDTGYIGSSNGAELTLEQMLLASNLPTTTTWDAEYPLAGYSFDDGCGTVSAGIFLKGEIGLDNQKTKITVAGGSDGMTVTGVIAPVAAVLAVSKAEAAYSGFLSFSVALSMAIDILRVTVPFTSSAVVNVAANSLSINNSADLTISALSGTIDFAFNYEYPCWIFATCSGSHEHNLASWSGPSQTWNLFNINGGTYNIGGTNGATEWLTQGVWISANQEHNYPLGWLGAGTHTITMAGADDADLYVRTGEAPTASTYDCRPYSGGSGETCTVTLSEPAPVYAMVRGYAPSTWYSLKRTES